MGKNLYTILYRKWEDFRQQRCSLYVGKVVIQLDLAALCAFRIGRTDRRIGTITLHLPGLLVIVLQRLQDVQQLTAHLI